MKKTWIWALFCLTACESKDSPDNSHLPYENGFIVLNEGNFMDNNGTITFISGNDAKYDIFQKENQRSLNGSVTGYTEAGNKGIILVDNSTGGQDLIEFVDAKTFKSTGTIAAGQIENPRKALKITEDKVYISAWDAIGSWPNTYINPGYVAVVDVNSGRITKKIPVQKGAESMVKIGNEVFVGNVYSDDSQITIINAVTDEVISTLKTAPNPELIGVDANGKLWYFDGDLRRLNPTSKEIESTIQVETGAATPSKFNLSSDKTTLIYSLSYYDEQYIERGNVYQMSIQDTKFNQERALISRVFYGLDVNEGTIFGTIVPSFKQAGYVLRYKENGTLIDSIKVEVGPSKFYFK